MKERPSRRSFAIADMGHHVCAICDGERALLGQDSVVEIRERPNDGNVGISEPQINRLIIGSKPGSIVKEKQLDVIR